MCMAPRKRKKHEAFHRGLVSAAHFSRKSQQHPGTFPFQLAPREKQEEKIM